MSARIQPQLAALSEDLAGARAELAMARDILSERGAALEECRLRMLIAETPVADRDLHRAAAVHALARAEVGRLEAAVATLRDEERRLTRGPA
jgi:HAMP domain-containing protein